MSPERVPTGIKGLDKLIEGGFVKGTTNLISGSAGTGKSILLLQFCWDGLQKGENCLFMSFQESVDDLKRDALQFGWDFSKFEKSGKFKIQYLDPIEIIEMQVKLQNTIREGKYSRVVIDSASLISLGQKDQNEARGKMFRLFESIKRTGTTTLVSSEIQEESKFLSSFGFEEFLVDGVIVLYYVGLGDGIYRNISVRKMRLTNHKHGLYPLEITGKGMSVKPNDN